MNRLANGNLSVPMDKSKDWQLEILMEKLRSKSSQFKPLPEISKTVRMTMLDKRYVLDSVEKSQHQKCLDTLQHSIKVTSLQSMIERLESLTRQLGLKFMVGPTGVELFISSDMFYLEVGLDPAGVVQDVKVHHESKMEQQSCGELVRCLARGDFADFTAQLEGFASIYQLNADKKIKCKAFTALQSLESDLSTLAQLQSFMKEAFNILYKSPVGVLEKRRGGHPMKLTYFVSPYDLLNTEKCDLEAITVESIVSKGLGYSVTVCMEGSATHKLQTTTLITVNRNINGKSTPSFSALSSQNSAPIPACFVLKLNKPMPMCVALVRQIQQITELDTIEQSVTHPLLSLIVHHSSDGKMESGNNKGLFVTLPDQNHCYFMTENKTMDGVLVSSIPFMHPAHVSQILVLLRQQALFNTIISSCVRPNSKQDFDNMTMFEIGALSWSHIFLSLEHPTEESMATAEVDLSDISNLICRIRCPGTPPPPSAPDPISELSTKILNRTFSIPITMRAVIKQWEAQSASMHRNDMFNGGHHENFSLPLGSGDPGGHKGGPSFTEFGGLDKIKREESPNHNNNNNNGASNFRFSSDFQGFHRQTEGILTNIELTNILAGTGDKTKAKRRKTDDFWRNKRRDDAEMLIESSSSDSNSRSTLISGEEAPNSSNSGLGFPSDLELSSLDPAELLGGDKSSDFGNLDDLGDVEAMLNRQKSPNFGDLNEKNRIPASVSITPIAFHAAHGGNAEKRPGIEIIPLASAANANSTSILPSSITITPIQGGAKADKDKKCAPKNRDDKNRLEKKRKRKRDESPMGPPEKVPPNPLTKPVTVSIKPSESPPLATPTSPSNILRKFTASPTHNRLSGKLSPNLIKPGLKSPKHSPSHLATSPKHSLPGISSPKHHGTSPKHPSTSGSGKPSMSTLKAANSPSNSAKSGLNTGEKIKSASSSRDKDAKKVVFNANKLKSTSKVKPLELATDLSGAGGEGLPSPGGGDLSKANQVRNRKGSLSAIVDKLKSAQHCDGIDVTNSGAKTSGGNGTGPASMAANAAKPAPGKIEGKSGSNNGGKVGEAKNSEYMVKPSSDGMKITINKTRMKETNKIGLNASKSGSGSPKTHTGLKPGVNSGPASKKPGGSGAQKMATATGGVNLTNNYVKSTKIASPGAKTSSTQQTTKTKLTNSPKMSLTATDLSRKERPKAKLAEKSIFGGEKSRGKSSPTPSRDEPDSGYNKSGKIDQYSSSLMMEGIMKQFDSKNFQIPKLSARGSNPDDKKQAKVEVNSVNRTVSAESSKILEIINKTGPGNDLSLPKYPLAVPAGKMFELAMDSGSKRASPKLAKEIDDEKGKEVGGQAQNLVSQAKTSDDCVKMAGIKSGEQANVVEPLSLTKSDTCAKFVAPLAPKDDKKEVKMSDGLLDFSTGKIAEKVGGVQFPQSPSVSVHIVKSPAPSPLITPSPHSASPCITDDELMDEALIGMGK